ncbi:hypothetical protein SDC9_50414 [bioreactor metagenome]|uniref:Uncharacterized protein n=1 Tax=bioreactor metagenome TaxID=1076179 RepID=A0A644WPD9_9ZZZZ
MEFFCFFAYNYFPVSKEEAILFITLAAAGFLLCRIPYVGKFLRVFNTLFHEGGHALAAWITSGEVLKVELFYDTSGTTITKSSSRGEQIIISLAGYVFASVVPWIFIILLSAGYEWALHISILALTIILLMVAVRNTFGVLWTLGMLAAYFLVLFMAPQYSWAMVYTFTGILLFEGLFSAIVVFWLSVRSPASSGDAANMSRYTGLPVWFWGFFFLAQAVFFFWLAVMMLF